MDTASLASLREALPEWEIEVVYGAAVASLPCDWDPSVADLLVLGVREDVSETLGLCQFLAFCTGYSGDSRQEKAGPLGLLRKPPAVARRADAVILVLIPPEKEDLVGPMLEWGAHSCLILPVHPKDIASTWAHAQAGNQPGRHTLNLEGAQCADSWRDDGGQG